MKKNNVNDDDLSYLYLAKKSVSYFAQYGKIENTNICFFDRIHEIISCDCIEKIVCKTKEVFMKNKIETSKSSTAFYYRLRYFMTIKDLDNYDKLSEASGLCRGNMATCLHHPERMNITKFKALISTLEVDREDTLEWLCQFLWGEDLATTVDKLKK